MDAELVLKPLLDHKLVLASQLAGLQARCAHAPASLKAQLQIQLDRLTGWIDLINSYALNYERDTLDESLEWQVNSTFGFPLPRRLQDAADTFDLAEAGISRDPAYGLVIQMADGSRYALRNTERAGRRVPCWAGPI